MLLYNHVGGPGFRLADEIEESIWLHEIPPSFPIHVDTLNHNLFNSAGNLNISKGDGNCNLPKNAGKLNLPKCSGKLNLSRRCR